MRTALLILLAALPAFAEGGGTVSGRVVDEDGKPIARAGIGSAKSCHAVTDADGRFAFVAKYGTQRTFWVRHKQFLGKTFFCAVPSSGHGIVLERGLSIRGRVMFPDGTPVARALITSSLLPHLIWYTGSSTTSAADGGFRLSGMEKGQRFRLASLGEFVDVTAGDEDVQVVVTHTVVRFTVRDATGRPMEASAWAHRLRGKERAGAAYPRGIARGEFLIPTWDADRILVSAVVEGYEMPVVEVPVAGRPRVVHAGITLRPLGKLARIFFSVRDADGRAPRRVGVRLWNAAGASPPRVGHQEVELVKGYGVVTGIPSGRYRFSVGPVSSERTYRLSQISDVDLTGGKAAKAAVVLPLGGRLRIQVKGAPRWEVMDGRWRLDVLDADGRVLPHGFRFPMPGNWSSHALPIPIGEYRVRVKRRDEVVVEQPVEIVAAKVTSLRITVPK